MSLQFILGNSGAGKTHYLYEEIIKQSIAYPDKNFILIVPEQYTMATQKELVKRHPYGGILNIDVLSLDRLAHRVYGELGVSKDLILDDEGKNLVLRKIAKNHENELIILGKNLRKFGYISEVKSLISEFSQYDIGVEGISELLEHMPQESMLSYKLQDLQKVYKGFEEYLDGKYITGEEHLDGLTAIVNQSNILKDCVITFDGFTGFTPVQSRLIEALLKVVETMYVTVTIDEKNSKQSYKGPYELFALSKEMIETLERLAAVNNIEICKPVCLFEHKENRHKESPSLKFLEGNIFRYKKEVFDESQKSIHIQANANPKEEALWVAHNIKKLVRNKGYRYKDIAIVASDLNSYDSHIKTALEAYDIPVFSDTKRSILLNSFVEYLRSLLEMIESNYGYQETFRYLKSSMTIGNVKGYGLFSEEMVDRLENHVLKYGIKGLKNWQQPWGLNCNEKEEQMYQYLNEKRVIFVEHITLLHNILKQKNKTVEDICRGLIEFFMENGIQSKIQERAEYFALKGELALEKEYTQVYQILLELMDKFVGILGEEKVSLREYIELLDGGLEEARIGIIPPSSDTVILGDLQRTRVDHIKALFYVGVSDLYVPGAMNDTGILSETERQRLETMQIKLKPSSKVQIYLQKFYLYLMLTKPSQYLYISYAKSTSQGKSARPAYVINELLKLYPKLEISMIGLSLDELELSPKMGLDIIVKGFNNKEIRGLSQWQELYNWYSLNEDTKEKLEVIKDAHYYKRLDMSLPDKLAKNLYGELLQNSVSRLEKFASCPYAHFLNYGLRLKERDIYEYQASDIGTILHDALEAYAKKVEEMGCRWGDISQEQQIIWGQEAVDEQVKNYNHNVFQKSARDSYMIERMKRLMNRSVWAITQQLDCGDFTPKAFELSFGFPGDDKEIGEVSISENVKMQLRGKIDRVDLWEDDNKVLVKVVDYKTGKKELSLESMYHGLQLQLFVYLDAALKHYKKDSEKEVLPGGVFYYKVDDPMVGEKTNETVDESILHSLNLDGLVSDVAIPFMDKELRGKSFAIPVSKTAKGDLSKTSKNMEQEQLLNVMEFAHEKVKELGREIIDGNIEISPYKKGKETGCDYCQYHNICGFDTTLGSYEYRELEELNKEDVLEKIKKGEE